jgi:hypothetical protein
MRRTLIAKPGLLEAPALPLRSYLHPASIGLVTFIGFSTF